MIVLFDLGNSRCKWCLWDQGVIRVQGAVAYTADGRLPGALFERLEDLPEAPVAAMACTVSAPELLETLEHRLQRRYGCQLQRFRTLARSGDVINAYPHPDSLGADRWAALLGARQRYTGALCIVDCGTAVTLDVLHADGRHAGGLIFPGLTLARRALSIGAHRLQDPGEGALPLLSNDTPTAIRAGTFHALAGGIEALKARTADASATPVTGILTGGDAPSVARALGPDWRVDGELIFAGMAQEVVTP